MLANVREIWAQLPLLIGAQLPRVFEVFERLRKIAETIVEKREIPVEGNARSARIDQLALALARAQGQFKNPEKNQTAHVQRKKKDGTPISYSYSYADLASVVDAIRGGLSVNELAYFQVTTYDGNCAYCITELIHSSDQFIRTSIPFPAAQSSIQDLGTVFTYLRRYALAALLGVAPEEDSDGRRNRKNRVEKTVNPITGPTPDRQDPHRMATREDISNFYKNFWVLSAKFGGREAAGAWLKEQDPNINQCTYARLKQLLQMAQAKPDVDNPELRQQIQTRWAIVCEKKGLGEDVRHWWAERKFGWVHDPAKGRASAVGTPLQKVKDAVWAIEKMKADGIQAIQDEYSLWLDDQRPREAQ